MKVSHCDTRWKWTSIVSKVAEQFGRFIPTLNIISLFQLNKISLRLQTHQNVSARTLKTKVLSSLTSHPTRIPNINELHSLTQFAHHTPSSFCCLESRLSKYNIIIKVLILFKLFAPFILLNGFKVILSNFIVEVSCCYCYWIVKFVKLSLCTKFCTYATKLSFSCNTMLFSYLNYISIAYFHCNYRYRYSITSY